MSAPQRQSGHRLHAAAHLDGIPLFHAAHPPPPPVVLDRRRDRVRAPAPAPGPRSPNAGAGDPQPDEHRGSPPPAAGRGRDDGGSARTEAAGRTASWPRPGTATAACTSASRSSRYAKHLLGAPYRYGGASPRSGFDCSGFVRYVYSHFGISLPHSSFGDLVEGRRVGRSALHPGDLVFFDGSRPRRHLRRQSALHPRAAHRHRRQHLDDERLVQHALCRGARARRDARRGPPRRRRGRRASSSGSRRHRHVAPAGGVVARAIVEEPAADVAAARLQPRPAAVGERPPPRPRRGSRARRGRRVGPREQRPPVPKRRPSRPSAAARSTVSSDVRPSGNAVVRERERAQRLAQLEGASEIPAMRAARPHRRARAPRARREAAAGS